MSVSLSGCGGRTGSETGVQFVMEASHVNLVERGVARIDDTDKIVCFLMKLCEQLGGGYQQTS